MSKTHWKKLYNPNFFGCYCFENGEDIIATIKTVKKEFVTSEGGKSEECTVIYFNENLKPFVCNKTNAKMITKIHGSPYVEDWIDKKIQLYRDPNVKYRGDIVEGVRIRPFIPKELPKKGEPIKCEKCSKEVQGYDKYSAYQIAQRNQAKYGQILCIECAQEAHEAGKAQDVL